MESSRGRPEPEAELQGPGAQPAAVSGDEPGRSPSEPPPGPRAGREEEGVDAGGAGRHPGVSPKTSSGGGGRRAPPEARQDQPDARGESPGTGSRRVALAPGRGRAGSPRPEGTEPPADRAASERAGRGGSPGGAGPGAEPDGEDEAAAAAGRAGRAFASRLQDSRSLDGLSGACGAAGPAAGVESGPGAGRRATISSPLELEGTVSRHGDLTHFVANNLQLKIRLSGASQPPLPVPARPCPAPGLTPAIPPIDPDVLRDLERLSRELGGRVDRLLRGLGGAVQELTALSVGCIQTYRDAVDSLGEAVDMSIKGMYTLLARCEELERALQPVQGLARQIRDIRRTLEVLEALCK
ncbi:BLOC-1-related complex subunit 6 [Sorex fumeus]|uniref:BLOC-1-related complex subunit 6 n=1 Tax=Sorex fumeus TaxID=62283 RepID=UPI0024ACFC66|nr:BLOC-1-related complex subunit 6 [Sorex fumeus]